MVWTRFHIWLVPQGPVSPQSGPDILQIRKKREQKCALYSMFHFLFCIVAIVKLSQVVDWLKSGYGSDGWQMAHKGFVLEMRRFLDFPTVSYVYYSGITRQIFFFFKCRFFCFCFCVWSLIFIHCICVINYSLFMFCYIFIMCLCVIYSLSFYFVYLSFITLWIGEEFCSFKINYSFGYWKKVYDPSDFLGFEMVGTSVCIWVAILISWSCYSAPPVGAQTTYPSEGKFAWI